MTNNTLFILFINLSFTILLNDIRIDIISNKKFMSAHKYYWNFEYFNAISYRIFGATFIAFKR